MIKTNLAVLMAERGLKIADVYEATGISKTTLMAISENTGKGIQYETMDKLCNFFGISPRKFFIYSPFRISVEWFNETDGLLKVPNLNNALSNIAVTVKKDDVSSTFKFNPVLVPKNSINIPITYRNNIDFGVLLGNWEFANFDYGNSSQSIDFINDFVNKLPVQFVTDFRKMIDEKITDNLYSLVDQDLALSEPDETLKDPNFMTIHSNTKYKIYTHYTINNKAFVKDKIIPFEAVLPF